MIIDIKALLLVKPSFDRVFNSSMTLGQAELFAAIGERFSDELLEHQKLRQILTRDSNTENTKLIESERKRLEGEPKEVIDAHLEKLGREKEDIYNAAVRALLETKIEFDYDPVPIERLNDFRISPLDLIAMRQIGVIGG